MTYTVSVRKEAEFDILEALDYYDEINPPLGNDFVLCVDEVMSRIARNPLHYQKIHKNVRRAFTRRYPFAVFFTIIGSCVIVLAVFHIQRDPQRWQLRS